MDIDDWNYWNQKVQRLKRKVNVLQDALEKERKEVKRLRSLLKEDNLIYGFYEKMLPGDEGC